jgi:D-sedoheptulose 7-phosphate isomerase
MKQRTGGLLNNLFDRYPGLNSCREKILAAYDLIEACYKGGGKILVCGNGGSAADSEHIVGELMKGFMSPRRLTPVQQEAFRAALPRADADYIITHLQQGLPAISLVSQSGLYSAYVNDAAADMVFAQQVFVYGSPGDVLIAITTSGASANVLRALAAAKVRGVKSILLMGQRNGQNAAMADVAVCVDESETYKVQEFHLPVYHALCAAIESEMFD